MQVDRAAKRAGPPKSIAKKILNVLGWVLIAVLLIATLIGMIWAGYQPKVHSIRGEPSDKPSAGKPGRCTTGRLLPPRPMAISG